MPIKGNLYFEIINIFAFTDVYLVWLRGIELYFVPLFFFIVDTGIS